MNYISSQFSFFKAGQGAFYGGRIWNESTKTCFTVVYDCGTSSFVKGNSQSLNSEIDFFKNHYLNSEHGCSAKNTIDLLFISHMDYDHVSGIKRLLNEFDVKKIILPYIDSAIRYYFLSSFDGDGDRGSDDLTLDDFGSFLQEPVKFIRDQEGSRETEVLFIKGGDKNIDFQNPISDDKGSMLDNQGETYEKGTLNQDEDEFSHDKNVRIYENNFQVYIDKYWEFATHVQEVKQENLEELLEGIISIDGTNKGQSLSIDDIKKLFRNDEKRNKLRNCYKDHLGDINSHGLVLLHGPINFKQLFKGYCRGSGIFHCNYHFENRDWEFNSLYTLLLGDTSLKPTNNPLAFSSEFKGKLKYVNIVQIPHHGSIKNWDKEAYENLNLGLNNCCENVIAICNFGVGNRYNHPASEILKEVEGTLVLNTQFTRFTTYYGIVVE